jgi:hypothetical protein
VHQGLFILTASTKHRGLISQLRDFRVRDDLAEVAHSTVS